MRSTTQRQSLFQLGSSLPRPPQLRALHVKNCGQEISGRDKMKGIQFMAEIPSLKPDPGPELKPPPDWPRFLDTLFTLPRSKVLAYTAILVALIVVLDSTSDEPLSLGLLYLFPIAIAAVALRRWQMGLLVLVTALLREHLGPWSWDTLSGSRMASTIFAFGSIGFLLNEVARNRRMSLRHFSEISEQVGLRKETEIQLSALAESTPAAILIVDNEGVIRLCNRAAEELLDVAAGHLEGRSIRTFLPTLADAAEETPGAHAYRTALTCRGRRANGASFQASAWFASYPTKEGTRLAAIVTDISEDLRESRENSLESLLRSTRVLVGSVSHEIRNMCAAISIVHANLGRLQNVRTSEDYTALGTLAEGLTRLATVEMKSANDPGMGAVDLASLSDEFRIVFEPSLAESSTRFIIEGFEGLPFVNGDHHSLLQVMLNLARNSTRAMEGIADRQLTIRALEEGGDVLIRFSDTGPGVKDPSNLFQAFQHGADAVGLGLFISRALVRSCGGDLFHEPTPTGCTMCIRLIPWSEDETQGPIDFSELHA